MSIDQPMQNSSALPQVLRPRPTVLRPRVKTDFDPGRPVDEPRSLICLHIIEQFAGATGSLLQFVLAAKLAGRRAVLPGVTTATTSDMTIYRGSNATSVRDVADFIDVSTFHTPQCMLAGVDVISVRNHQLVAGPRIDALVIIVLNTQARAWFTPAPKPAPVGAMLCPEIWLQCLSQPGQCGNRFMCAARRSACSCSALLVTRSCLRS